MGFGNRINGYSHAGSNRKNVRDKEDTDHTAAPRVGLGGFIRDVVV